MWAALACDSLSQEPKQQPMQRSMQEPAPESAGGEASQPPSLDLGPLTLAGAPPVEPVEDPTQQPDWCETAALNGAVFCEADATTLDYCVPAPPDGETCPVLQPDQRPPDWVWDLMLQCFAHCGVGIATSERMLDDACCYVASTEYYGR
jgi:hypothetical protein